MIRVKQTEVGQMVRAAGVANGTGDIALVRVVGRAWTQSEVVISPQ